MKVVAYLRVSKEKQDVENQRHEVIEYCRKAWIEIDEFITEVASRVKKDKKIWPVMSMLDKGDMLIITEISRVAGSVMQAFEFMKECLDRGIVAYFIKQNFKLDEENTISEAIMFGFGLAAKIERDLISSRTKEALKRKKHEAEIRGEKFGIGWEKGRKRGRLLDGKNVEIMKKVKSGVNKKALANEYGVSIMTLYNYIHSLSVL
jgi:DNA invertase Pin-like site-specific DNA recombinase